MKRIFFVLIVWAGAVSAPAALRVVATLPDFCALAEAVGGVRIESECMARGTEDPHFVDARPSFVRLLNKADVLLEGGAQLELGWLPPLVNNARNRKIDEGAPGRVVMSRGLELLEVPTGPVDRSMGDVHPVGNPHYWLDPANDIVMAKQLAEAFSRLDASHAAEFRANAQRFEEKMKGKLTEWQRQLEPYRGTKVVTYHKSFEYFARRFGLEIVGQIEPKPGIEPSPSYITALIGRLKGQGIKLVLAEPNRPKRTAQYVADQIGAKSLVLPIMVGGAENIRDPFDLFAYDVAQIVSALKNP